MTRATTAVPTEIPRTFNGRHPERRRGEIFFSNILDPRELATFNWKTRRLGALAYRSDGIRTSGYPVFVRYDEIIAEEPWVLVQLCMSGHIHPDGPR